MLALAKMVVFMSAFMTLTWAVLWALLTRKTITSYRDCRICKEVLNPNRNIFCIKCRSRLPRNF